MAKVIDIVKTDNPLAHRRILKLVNLLSSGTLTHGKPISGPKLRNLVRQTISDVRKRGDARVVEDTRELHHCPRFQIENIRVPESDIRAAHAEQEKTDRRFLEIIRRVIANIREYQESILLGNPSPLARGGRTLSVRYTPVERVCLYVPGGRAAYPSSVLMTAVPAQVAGVREVAMLTPPQDDGSVLPMVLAVAHELGITEIYRVAGVAGLAAMAFGTQSIRRVDKIVGPGSAYIAEAKRQLFGRVGIDSIAGPSEVLILADDTARPDWVAADMLAQAEHDPGSAVLVTTSQKLAKNVASALLQQVAGLQREEAARVALKKYSLMIVVPGIDIACDVANDFAPEHLQIITADDEAVLKKVRNAGAIFLGAGTPVPLGDYYAGPSHVLPTGGTARFFSALSCNDFLKASSVIRYDAASLAADAPDVIDFASREGLTAHAEAVRIRGKGNREQNGRDTVI